MKPSRSIHLYIYTSIYLSFCSSVDVFAQLSSHDAESTSEIAAATDCLNSSRVLIGYDVVNRPRSLTKVELYYTSDAGETWKQAKLEKEVQNPIVFDAPGDGLYGLYIVLQNARGAMPLPQPGTAAHRWVRVNHTPPAVQVLSLKPDDHFDLNRELHIRWSVSDESLSARPVALHFRTTQTKTFQLIAESQAAVSSKRWTVPDELSGRLEVKVSAADCAGNRGEYVADWLILGGDKVERQPTAPGEDRWQLSTDNPDRSKKKKPVATTAAKSEDSEGGEDDETAGAIAAEPDAGEQTLAEPTADEAKKLYDRATWHRLRGEYDLALVRFQEALQRDEDFLAARNDLAGLYFLQGHLAEATSEFKIVLEKDPKYRPALKGLALVQAKEKKYKSAHTSLQKLLLLDAEDAEAWLNFGDVCLFMGDSTAAQQAWDKATQIKTAAPAIKSRAEKRLKMYAPKTARAGLETEPGEAQ